MDNNNTPAGTPQVGLFFGILAGSTASIFIRFAQGEAPSLLIAAGRMLGATLLLFPFAIRHLREDLKKVSGRTISFLVTAGIFLACILPPGLRRWNTPVWQVLWCLLPLRRFGWPYCHQSY
jgi:drug/metabolite transporter (DMT)-like permease